MGPIEGITVIELSDNQAGAIAGMLLSDYGADVIRIEHPRQDLIHQKPGYTVWNRGKQSMTLNIESQKGRTAFLRLLSTADILIETLEPPKMQKLGIDYDSLHDSYPELVYCSLTGYEIGGPDYGRPAYDGLIQARGGIMTGGNWIPGGFGSEQAGHRDGPKFMGFAAPSYSAAFFACLGVLTAIYVRGITGRGQHVNSSLHASTMAMSRWGWAETPGPSPAPARGLYGVWECQDGQWLWTHTGARNSFDRFMDVFNFLEYKSSLTVPLVWSAELSRELRDRVSAAFKTKARDEWMQLFDDADCPNQPTLNPGEAFNDEQTQHIEMVMRVEDSAFGELQEVGLPIKFERTPGTPPSSAPTLGSNTEAILENLGYGPRDVSDLKNEGVI